MVTCICVGCKSGYRSNQAQDKVDKISFFRAPNDKKVLKQWQEAIKREGYKVKSGDFCCSRHFHAEDIISEKIFTGPDGSIVAKSPYQFPRMRKGAVPSLNLGHPEKPAPKTRTFSVKRSLERENQTPDSTCKKQKNDTEIENNPASTDDQGCADKLDINQINNQTDTPDPFALLFKQIFLNQNGVRMPIAWSRSNVSWGGRLGVTFCTRIGIRGKNGHIDSVCNKEITIDDSMTILVKLNGQFVNYSEFGIQSHQLHSEKDLEEVIERVNKCKICQGCPDVNLSQENLHYLTSFSYTDKIDILRHKNCSLILPEEINDLKTKGNNQCKNCKNVKHLLQQKILRRQHNKQSNYLKVSELSPRKREKLKKIAQTLKSTSRAKERAQTNVRLLRRVIKEYQGKMIRMSEENLENIMKDLEKISANEKVAIKEIFKAARKKDPRGRRYSDEWIILSLLLHMRSAATYRMILNNKMLPVPSVRSIRRYLSQMDCPCGFDKRFFEILKEHFAGKSGKELHGLLLVDEMSTRKNLLLDQKTMTFKGVEDFGDDVPKDLDKEMADHGLVIMYQPLYEAAAQPIAVFASQGSIHGDVLAKLVVQAIVLLEQAGAKIHGIVADGGAPNRRMWTEMGCSGKLGKGIFKNWFEHPMDGSRKVFFFSDAPHLMKTIRNRLANGSKLKVHPDESSIEWEHFELLYELDKNQPITKRLCPNLTDSHIFIKDNSLLKMRVSLALQVFSRSTARGFRFYALFEERLRSSCESVARFCEILNDMFDALNRTSVETGLRLGCEDIRILHETLEWLDEWERKVQENLIGPDEFLTSQTAEGLRMTLNSTLDLTSYLLEVMKFDVVLTGRINQDSLEVFHRALKSRRKNE